MRIFVAFACLVFSCCTTVKTDNFVKLKVSSNQRYIETADGKPFIYLACTAWELFHKLSREEADLYLTNRAQKGFTVIQAVVLAELDGLKTPNFYGQMPLVDNNPETPNEQYFEHVDYIVNKAQELGLQIAMLPTWGDKVTAEHGGGPVIFTPENAAVFGEFLGKRYREKPIIWVLGGDRLVTNDTVLAVWRAMAQGLRKGDNGNHLISFHPRGDCSSSFWLHNESWLDLNMYQSGHARRFNRVYNFASHDYLLQPVKPFIDSEPAYEDIAICFWEYMLWNHVSKYPSTVLDSNYLISNPAHFKKGFFTDYDVRVHGYWNFLSGACGYTYGNNAIWQMCRNKEAIIPCLYTWDKSLDRPGAEQIIYLKKLFTSRSFAQLIPDQSLLYGVPAHDSTYLAGAVATNGSFAIAYAALGQPMDICMSKITSIDVSAWWYNPRNGQATKIGTYSNKKIQRFVPPTSGLNNDWVLVLDNPSVFKNAPGEN